MDVVVLNQNEAIRVGVACAELYIAPLECNQFTATKASPDCDKKERMMFGLDSLCRAKELLYLRGRQRNSLYSGGSGSPGEPSQPRRRISVDQTIFDGLVEDASEDTNRVSDRASCEIPPDHVSNELFDSVAIEFVHANRRESWTKIQPYCAFVSSHG